MPSRYRDVLDALAGYHKTGIPLIAFNGTAFGPAGALDDLGSYYLISKLSVLLKLSAAQAIDRFYFSLLVLAFVIGTMGCCANLTTMLGKWLAPIWVTLVVVCAYHSGDVYILSAFIPLALAPWLLFLTQRHSRPRFLQIFLFVEGLLIGVAHTVRAHSGTALLLFTLSILLFQIDLPRTRRVWLTVVLLAGILIPQFYLRMLVAKRDVFLASVCPSCPRLSAHHPFWHSVYIGFGFLSNEIVAKYDDTVGYSRVQTVAPGTVFGSIDYDRVLQREVFALVLRHPRLVITTLAAKIGVLLFVFLAVGNIGLLAAARYRKAWPIELAFWLAIAFSSLPGLLVIPTSDGYVLGLVTFASLYAVSSIDFALSAGAGRDLRHLFQQLSRKRMELSRSGDRARRPTGLVARVLYEKVRF